nr:hypothetical protein StreXyl84_77830 [Streptomyces sp. Xyl84]
MEAGTGCRLLRGRVERVHSRALPGAREPVANQVAYRRGGGAAYAGGSRCGGGCHQLDHG